MQSRRRCRGTCACSGARRADGSSAAPSEHSRRTGLPSGCCGSGIGAAAGAAGAAVLGRSAVLWDGWRERIPFSDWYEIVPAPDASSMDEWQGPAGSIPAISSSPVVACFGAHRGDPSALLVPDAHYLHDFHRVLFTRAALSRRRWSRKIPRAIFCGSDHGETANQLPPLDPARPVARRQLAEIAATGRLPVDVHLGAGISRRRQVAYRYLLDVDGEAHTWDAWAWKLRSGSVVLSQESIWNTFFTTSSLPGSTSSRSPTISPTSTRSWSGAWRTTRNAARWRAARRPACRACVPPGARRRALVVGAPRAPVQLGIEPSRATTSSAASRNLWRKPLALQRSACSRSRARRTSSG